MSTLQVQKPNLTFQDEYRLMKKREATSAWYNPSLEEVKENGVLLLPEHIYIGEKNMAPTWEEPVFDVKQYRTAKQLYREGKIDDDRLKFSPWKGDWDDAYNEYLDAMKYGYRSAAIGVVTSDDNPAINVIQMLGEILGRDQRQYNLEQAVTRVATPNLTLSIDTWNGFTASQDVGEGVEAFVKKGKFTRQEFALKKDVGHVMFTDEAQMRADRDIYTQHVQHVAQDLRRIKALSIATELETAPDIASADWAAYTTDHSTTDPVAAIGEAADIIEANGGNPNTIASHARPLRDFSSNTHVKGMIQPSASLQFGGRVVNGVPGLPGFTWYVDNLKTNTLVTVYDKAAILLMQGPTRTAQYRHEGKGMDAYITRDWYNVQIIDDSLVRDVTGVSA